MNTKMRFTKSGDAKGWNTPEKWVFADTDEEYAGFAQAGGGLTYAIVRGAGHILPYDQPRAALDMLDHFIEGRAFSG